MDGVTILNTFVEKGAVMQPWCTIGISMCCCGVIGSIVGVIIAGKYKNTKWLKTLFVICLTCIIISLLICGFAPRETEDRYQVIIDDTVSFNEFYEHYEVLEINGKIYTVRVLTNEE